MKTTPFPLDATSLLPANLPTGRSSYLLIRYITYFHIVCLLAVYFP